MVGSATPSGVAAPEVGYWQAALLGLVQGLTEFLPISSSAHLRIVGDLIGTDAGAAFTAVTQIGTETAVLVFFWRDIVRIVRAWALSLAGRVPRDDPDARMGWLIIIGTVPIAVLGLLFDDLISTGGRNLWVVGTTLWVFALILLWADMTARQTTRLDQLSWRDGVLLGLAQAMALIPGVSRSGGTITMGLILGYTREAAARYSFLLAMPAVFAAGLYEAKDIGSAEAPVAWGPTILGTVIAFGVGAACIAWFLRYVSNRSFQVFVWYRLALAALVYVLLIAGVLHPTP